MHDYEYIFFSDISFTKGTSDFNEALTTSSATKFPNFFYANFWSVCSLIASCAFPLMRQNLSLSQLWPSSLIRSGLDSLYSSPVVFRRAATERSERLSERLRPHGTWHLSQPSVRLKWRMRMVSVNPMVNPRINSVIRLHVIVDYILQKSYERIVAS